MNKEYLIPIAPKMKIKVPSVPNFLIDENGNSYSVMLFTEAELRMVADTWKKALIQNRHNKLNTKNKKNQTP